MRRVLTGALIAVLGFGAIYWLETSAIKVLAGLICALLAYEWSRLSERDSPAQVAPQIVLTIVLILALFAWPEILPWWLVAVGVWWLAAFVCVVSYAADEPVGQWRRLLFRAGMPLVISSAWGAFVALHAADKLWLLYVIVIVSLSDIGAYYVGRKFGNKRLCPDLSPGKTRAGLWGGMGLALLFSVGVAASIMPVWIDGVHLVLVSLCVVQVGVVGDLFVSALKRHAKVKDTGALLPGHGGALDRLDSLLPALPLFYAAISGWFLW